MKEVVLGLGQQKSLWSVVPMADEQLRTIHGSPRRMIVRSGGIEIKAARPQFEGDFQSFTVRFPRPSPSLECLFNDTKAISESILSGNTIGVKVGMQQDASNSFLFEKYLYDLYKKDVIARETARDNASEPAIFDQMKLGTYAAPPLRSMMQH